MRPLICSIAVILGLAHVSIAQDRSSSLYETSQKSGTVSKDIGAEIVFNTIDLAGNKCVMIYGGPSLRQDGFIIQDCGGLSWEKKWGYSNGVIKRMALQNERVGWLVIGHVLATAERIGDTFELKVVRNESDENIEDAFFLDEQYGWICGNKGMISKTEDGGLTWKQEVVPTDIELKEIKFINHLEGWARGAEYKDGGFQAILLKTTDGGEHWMPSESEEEQDLSPIFFTSTTHGCGVNENNAIVCTNDGQRWRVMYSDQGKSKRAIFFLNNMDGWIAGESIWHTSDGGETWQKQFTLPNSAQDFEQIVFANENLGWARSLTEIWRTTDSGKTWKKISDVWLANLKDRSRPQ
jgi:photosystem II stability/assembly factor-like uncharacterized protein